MMNCLPENLMLLFYQKGLMQIISSMGAGVKQKIFYLNL